MAAPDKKVNRRTFLKYAGVGSATAFATLAYGDHGSSRVELVKRTVHLPRWDADGIRVGVLADLHLDDSEAVERAISAIALLIENKPDVIVCVGDYLTSASTGRLQNVQRTLAELDAFAGPVLGILGNHDYTTPNLERVVKAVSGSKVRLLRNEVTELSGIRFWGLDDALKNQYRPDLVEGDRNTVVLLHEPDFVKEIPHGPSLQISGHSHGGQICLPGGIALHTPRGAKKYVAGFYDRADLALYVSRGVGTTGPNWRLFCPPEATILTLRGS